MGSNGMKTTRDLALAAYIKMHGLEIVKAVRTGRYKFEFAFRDPEGRFDSLRLGFANSECHRFDSEMRTLKKLTMGGSQ